ncbi:MAG TPA: peptidoglycan DD-metalloendopeptidase family protein [Anaerolinea sp.]|nr:peptidoglycan DD-metalloendopeptidase family protein [Anaerolinea sp.]
MIRKKSIGAQPAQPAAAAPRSRDLLFWVSWAGAFLMVVWLSYVILLRTGVVSAAEETSLTRAELATAVPSQSNSIASLPGFSPSSGMDAVVRSAELHTIIPTRARTAPEDYVVSIGDSVFGIAQKFKLQPETVLWANYTLLNDNPNMLSVGQDLTIPAADGVLYKVKANDTIESIAREFQASPEDIISWPENHIDIADPQVVAGAQIMIPNGKREMRSWVVPTIWRANSGANKTVNAACDTSGASAYGSGYFMWPADNHTISGNTFWSGHLGIDIAAAMGAPIYAADSGVVVYAAPIGGGYGNMVMIDHGNGFHTLYAHLSQILVRCGSNVIKGQVIAYAGSTGNSTGPHLHFEIRYLGAFVNPLDYTN